MGDIQEEPHYPWWLSVESRDEWWAGKVAKAQYRAEHPLPKWNWTVGRVAATVIVWAVLLTVLYLVFVWEPSYRTVGDAIKNGCAGSPDC